MAQYRLPAYQAGDNRVAKHTEPGGRFAIEQETGSFQCPSPALLRQPVLLPADHFVAALLEFRQQCDHPCAGHVVLFLRQHCKAAS